MSRILKVAFYHQNYMLSIKEMLPVFLKEEQKDTF